MTAEPQRFFFAHVQKTAGTALFKRMVDHFGRAAVYPDDTDGPNPDTVLLPEVAIARFAARRDEIRVVTGHLPLFVADLLAAELTTLTVLRDPVERTLSYLRHHRVLHPEARDVPLERIYEDPFRFQGLIHNHMVKMFCLGPEAISGGVLTHMTFEQHHLDRAIERLATVDVVGVQERFDPFCAELERRFGWDLGPPVHANRTAAVEVSDELRRRIAEDNAFDVELYEHARDRLAV